MLQSIAGQVNNVTNHVEEALENLKERVCSGLPRSCLLVLTSQPADFKSYNPALNNLEVTYAAVGTLQDSWNGLFNTNHMANSSTCCQYIDDIPYVADAVGMKGRNFHVELNKPVADALSKLITAVMVCIISIRSQRYDVHRLIIVI